MSGKPKKTYGKKVTAHVSGWFARDLWNAAVPAATAASTAPTAANTTATAGAAGGSGSGSASASSGNGGRSGSVNGGSGGKGRPAVLDLDSDSDSDDDEDQVGGRGKDEDEEDDEEEKHSGRGSSGKNGNLNGNGNGKATAPAVRNRTNTATNGTTTAAASPDSDSESESDTYSDTYSAPGIAVTVTSPHSTRRRPKPSLARSDSDSDSEDDDSEDDLVDIPGTPEYEELEANILALLTPTPTLTPATTPSAPETSDKENDLPASTASSPGSHPPARRTRTPTGVPGSPREALKERAITPIESPARKNGVRKKRASVVSPLVRERPGSGVGVDIKVWEDGKERGDEREMLEKMRRVTIGLEEVLELGGMKGGVQVEEVERGCAGSDTSELTELDAEEEEQEGEREYEEDEVEYYVDDAAIEELLSLCTTPTVLDFTDYITALQTTHTITKLGEASYSEVFLSTPLTPSSPSSRTTVLKIIPFAAADQCTLTSILQEVSITRTMASHRGFIGFHGAHVCRGYFPEALMRCWDEYEELRGSENERPEFYGEGQWWAVVGLEMGGVDLEHFELKGWREALDVFWQVAEALAGGEGCEFEHRDLHYGNIVIQRRPTGLKVSLIDYTLSRALCPPLPSTSTTTPRAHFAPLDDPALFSGKGDYQFDIYRFMRTHLSSGLVPPDEEDINWDVYAPRTNVFWLHYLACVLLRRKGLPRGRRIAGDGEKGAFEAVERIVAGIDPRKRRFGGGEVGSAGEVLAWAGAEGLWVGREEGV
ncbi:uncharacterized protein H6S33_007796 [Morchella sextelata]|uniref:uncharacterized protein n=1 Tax=Morchella sextelata TaxID=1174677 RepID=UPI001D04BF44|nr:uncharacterized protein H6S33_007796 [Morchella sextelata]KAH0603474.1 hypothetical protein H6S33_007796 [Morchella sextelata]